MPLYNTLSAAQRAKWIDEAGKERLTLSFYKYHCLDNPQAWRDRFYADWEAMDVLGRIYVAQEGINAQLSLPAENMAAFHAYLEAVDFLRGIRLNVAIEQSNKSFLKLKIKVRPKILADGIEDDSFDATKTGPHLAAAEFNDLVENPDTLLVDMRNHFESEIGHFPGAVLPESETFRQALRETADKLVDYKKDKSVIMYCTGGIRCEKASAFFLHQGYSKVYQLEGGIIHYLHQIEKSGLPNKFLGKNFVFDQRLAEKVSEDVVATCHQCNQPCDTHINCGNKACNILFLQCRECREKWSQCCSERCKSIASLPHAQQKALRKGNSASAKYFKKTER